MKSPSLGRRAVWILVAAYLVGMGVWIYSAGMRLRDNVWTETRTLREENNITNGFRWGQQVLRTAERTAKSPEMQKWGKSDGTHELTFWELIRGEDLVYQDLLMGRTPSGDFDLDYPPLRLLAMTLWARHTEAQAPGIQGWPGYWRLDYSATASRLDLADEDLARPLILGNSYAIAGSALAAFFLVWVWVNRGGRPALPGSRKLIPWKPAPLSRSYGLIIFSLAAWAFFYAMLIAESPVPSSPPAIAFSGRPILTKTADGKITATINATVDTQGGDSQWHVDWGTSSRYGKQTPTQATGDDDCTASLDGLPVNTIIHYRLTANNEHGLVHSDDQFFNTSDRLPPQPPTHWYGAVWLSWQQWLGLAALFSLMTGSIGILPREHQGWAAGMAAAFLMWLNPAVLIDTHIWPQWDAWALLPFFVAALFASLDWWLTAGLVLGAGVMFKGQLLLIVPIFALWPLFGGRIGPALRLIIGALLSAGLVLSPWVVLGNQPPTWTAGPLRWIPAVMAAAVVALGMSLYRRRLWHGQASLHELILMGCSLLGGIVVTTLLLLRHWPADSELPRASGLALLAGVLLPPWILPRRSLGVWMAAVFAASIWMSAFLFHGDWSWKAVGFDYGTRKHTQMSVTPGVMGNLPQAMEKRFGWDVYDAALTLHPPDLADALHWPKRAADGTLTGWAHDWGWDGTPVTLDIRTLLITIFAILMALTAAGAALHSRRNDPRILACFAAIWTLMPNVLCQMHVRYQMWAAAASSILIGLSGGLGAVHVVISLLAAGMLSAALLSHDAARSPKVLALMSRFQPDDGWIMLLLGLIILYIALAPGRRPRQEELLSP